MATTTKTKRKSTYIRFLNSIRKRLKCTAMEVEGRVNDALSANARTQAKMDQEIAKRDEQIKGPDRQV